MYHGRMKIQLVDEVHGNLPLDDDHPYRTGPWKPNTREFDAFDLDVIGQLPLDLNGVYLRNTENPLHGAIGRYHPFDGDGMLHSVSFDSGNVEYRNRYIRTDGFNAELESGTPLWAGLMENPQKSKRQGWGARTGLKDSSSTDVVVHRGRATTSFYQCGDIYELDPKTLHQLGKANWTKDVTPGWGVSAHTKVDPSSGEMLFFNYSKQKPYMHYGVVDSDGKLVHYVPIELPGPRLPHDMAFTENYAILNDLPLFWDPEALSHGAHAVRFFRDIPSRFAVIPRRGQVSDIRWFEAEPTYVLHWINAYEEGDEVILDGYAQDPSKAVSVDLPENLIPYRMLDIHSVGARAYRWRFNMQTGSVSEQPLDDTISEFGMINPDVAGKPYQYVWEMTTKPGWFLFNGITRLNVKTGERQGYEFRPGVYASESPVIPARTIDREDGGYVVTLISDMNEDSSSCLVFKADDLPSGPIASIKLPERICVGTHSYWENASR